MKTCRKTFAVILLALAMGIPVIAGDVNSTPTYPAPPPPPPCAPATQGATASDCSDNGSLPSVGADATALVMDLISSMLSIY